MTTLLVEDDKSYVKHEHPMMNKYFSTVVALNYNLEN